MAKLVRGDMPREMYAIWDAYDGLITAAKHHNQVLQKILPYRQLMGLWGGFTNTAFRTQRVPPATRRIAELVGGILAELAQSEKRAADAVRQPLINLWTEAEALLK